MAASEVKTKHPGIYKRGSRFVVRVADASGSLRRFSCETLAEALQIQGQQKAAAAAGRAARKPKSQQSVYEYGKAFLSDYDGKTNGARRNTVDEYVDLLDRFVKNTALGKRSISTVDVNHVKAWIKPLQQKYAPAYIRRILVPMRAIFRHAIEDRLLDGDPSATISTVSPKPDPVSKTRTSEQVQMIIDQIQGEGNRLAATVIAQTGIRISEMAGFDQRDFNPGGDGGPPRVHVRQRVRDGMKDAPKSERGKRWIPIPEDLASQIETYVAGLSWQEADAPLFQTIRGGRIDVRNWRRRAFNQAREAAAKKAAEDGDASLAHALATTTPHMFRHSAARRWRNNDVKMEVISKLLGHSSASFTLNTYGGVIDEDIPDAAQLSM